MKYIKRVFTFLGVCSALSASAQYHPAGDWLGTLDAGSIKLRIVFHIQEERDGSLKATMDSPDQGVKGVQVPQVRQTGDSLLFSLGIANFNGSWIDDSTVAGTFFQGRAIPLTIHKTKFTERLRPQTPKPPFPYKSEDLTFTNKDKSIIYGGTLTAPNDGKRHPALILVTGSGQQNRDEEIKEHKPFAIIADYLTRRGFVVLRTDDRGKGLTTGSLINVSTADFAQDASTALDYLKSRPEADTQRLGVLGHSEGGMIATMLAAQRADIAFIVSLAGPGVAIRQTMIEQNDAVLKGAGIDESQRAAYLKLYRSIIDLVPRYGTEDSLAAAIEQAVGRWRKITPAAIVEGRTGIKDAETQQSFARSFAKTLGGSWWRYFLAYDPQPQIQRLSCKVLALNGSNDIQVVPASNLSGWRSGLKKSHTKTYEVKELPGLNHLFQECRRCDVDEYGELEQTISPAALAAIDDWMSKEMAYPAR